MEKTSLTVRIEKADKERLEQYAKEDDRSVSYIVGQAIKKFITDRESNK